MKYYKNLIKRKKYGVVIVSMLFFILGFCAFYFNLIEVIKFGIMWTGLSPNVIIDNGIAGGIGATNIGMMLVGLGIIYIALVFIPKVSMYSQDDSDYTVKLIEDDMYVKYRDKEFLVKRQNYNANDFFFKDKNGKFVSMTTGYQIYNYIKPKKFAELKIDEEKIINDDNIITNFKNIRLMNNEEKNKYIKYRELENNINIVGLILTIILYAIAIFFAFGGLVYIINDFGTFIVSAIIAFITFKLGKAAYKASKRDKVLINKIFNGDMYIAECYSYDKKIEDYYSSSGTHHIEYYIKITDNNGHYIDKWFQIPEKVYKNNDIITASLIILGPKGEEIFEVITNY